MGFESIYQHGFVRVAACTGRVAIADPPVNAELVLRSARECSDEGVAVALFPEMTLTGYSLEDLVLQDAVLDDVERSLATVVEGSADLLPLIVFGAPLRHRNRIYNCAVVVHRGRVLGVVPKSYPPTYREFYEGRQLASGVGERGEIRVGGADVPFGTDLLFAADDVPGLVVHAEVCEDMWIPVPPSAEAALAGATLLLNLSGSPITVGRAEDRKLLCRSASSRCLAAYAYSAAGQGESSTDLAWDGQTTIYENGVLLAETERFADGDRRAVADVDLDLLLQERRRMGTFDDNRRAHADRTDAFRHVGFTLDPPDADLGLRRSVERYPFVPADVDRLNLDCYEAYNIQVAGLQQRLRAIGDPKVVIGVSGGLDSTQALLVAAQAMDRAGRPRSDILGFTLPGLRHQRGHQGQRAPADGRARHHRRGDRHQAHRAADARGDRPSVREGRGGLRRDVRERPGRAADGLPVPDRQPARRHRPRHRRPLGAGARLGHLRGRRPDEPLQRQRRRPEDVHPAPDPLGGRAAGSSSRRSARRSPRSSTPRSAPSWCRARSCSRRSPRSARTRCTTSRSSTRCATASGPRRSASWRGTPGATPTTGTWPPNFPDDKRVAYDRPEIRRWLGFFCERFFAFAQFKRSAMPNGPKVSAGGSLSPRGDWRAPSDGSAAAWLRDLERWDWDGR